MNALAFGLALRAPGAAPRVTRRPRRLRVTAIASSPNGMSVADLAEPCLPSHGRSPTELAQIGAANNKKGANSNKADSANAKKGGKKAVVSKGSQPAADPGLYDVMLSGATFALIVGGGLFAFPEMAKAIGVLPSDESVWSTKAKPAPARPSSRNDRLYVPYADVKAEMAAAAAAAEAHWSTRPKPPGSGLSKTQPVEPTPELEPETEKETETETETETVNAITAVVSPTADVQPAGAIATSTSSTDVNSTLGDLISSPLFYVTFGVAAAVALVQVLERSGVENAEFGLSALPIVLLTAISKTEFGAGLAKSIEDRRPELEAERARVERERAAARATMPAHYGPTRRKFLPDGFGYAFPAHLDGTLCGDAGFDPLGLASGSMGDLDRYRELELLHGRWAMLGVVGAAVPEALARFGGFELGEPVWWKVGEAKLNSPDLALDYLGLGGFHIAGSSGLAVIAACQLVLMGGPEYARFVGIDSLVPVGVYLPGDRDYPGGAPFDPFGVSADAAVFERQKVAEMKHGRLAMVAMLGCFAQAWATGVGPVENLTETWEKLRAFL